MILNKIRELQTALIVCRYSFGQCKENNGTLHSVCHASGPRSETVIFEYEDGSKNAAFGT
jgi:hypothetical protein